jgi:uncharacterized protein (TIGR03437 family)
MRWNGCLISLALAALVSGPAPSAAASFGTVVPIGGHASDIALDEARGLLYIANFTANRIEVMSMADYSIHTSMNVAPQPSSLAISPDFKYLLISHYGNITPVDPSRNAVTLINLSDNTRQTFTTGDTPLGVAFLADGRGVIVTTASLLAFDPVSGAMSVVATFAGLAKTVPVSLGTFPSQIILTSVATNADKTVLYALTDDGSSQGFVRLDIRPGGGLFAGTFIASPKPLPRVSVPADGSRVIMGQYLFDTQRAEGFVGFSLLAELPESIASTNTGAAAFDSRTGNLWGQMLSASTNGGPPLLYNMDGENLYVNETFSIPENLAGRALFNSDSSVLYAISDSGVTVFPVGRLNQQHRLKTSVSDVVARGSFCNRNVITQTLTITDPGGGNTDFTVTSTTTGVTISPSSGLTPAVVQVRVDPVAFQNQNGTLAVSLKVSSASAVNVTPPIRLLINNRNPDQRGTFVNVPGNLTDLLADPVRNRFYIVVQDKAQVLVFDSTTYQQVATLKTSTTPTQISFTFDRKYLLVGHNDSQQIWVYDLDSLQRQPPILMPAGHYPRSIAESGKSLLSLVRNANSASGGPGVIDRVDFAARRGTQLPTLGVYTNSVHPGGVMAPAPNGGTVLVAMPDGNVMLYDANADTFTVSRQDVKGLSGSYAASSYNTYIVGNSMLNASLVPSGTLESSTGSASGFAFVDQGGFRTTAPAAASPGVIERFDAAQSGATGRPTRLVEAPLVPAQNALQQFIRSVAPLYDRSGVIALTISGFTVLPWNYDAAVAPPKIGAVVNAADGKLPVAPGGLISVYGQQMAPVNMATKELPLPTALADSCLTVNGVPVPVLFVSNSQINGQLPFNIDGNAQMTLRTPGGISDNFNFSILPAAPSVFRTGSAGPETGLATITRSDNGQFITPTNPVHYNDSITIWATGLGRTNPPIDAGDAAPADPLPSAVIAPSVLLGGTPLRIDYAGLVPGSVGLYQINAYVPPGVPQGLDIPLVISQGGTSTTLSVRVVK